MLLKHSNAMQKHNAIIFRKLFQISFIPSNSNRTAQQQKKTGKSEKKTVCNV